MGKTRGWGDASEAVGSRWRWRPLQRAALSGQQLACPPPGFTLESLSGVPEIPSFRGVAIGWWTWLG